MKLKECTDLEIDDTEDNNLIDEVLQETNPKKTLD